MPTVCHMNPVTLLEAQSVARHNLPPWCCAGDRVLLKESSYDLQPSPHTFYDNFQPHHALAASLGRPALSGPESSNGLQSRLGRPANSQTETCPLGVGTTSSPGQSLPRSQSSLHPRSDAMANLLLGLLVLDSRDGGSLLGDTLGAALASCLVLCSASLHLVLKNLGAGLLGLGLVDVVHKNALSTARGPVSVPSTVTSTENFPCSPCS